MPRHGGRTSCTCPRCGVSASCDVEDTRPSDLGLYRRRRRCPSCNSTFYTVELPEELLKREDLAHWVSESRVVRRALNNFIKEMNTFHHNLSTAAEKK